MNVQDKYHLTVHRVNHPCEGISQLWCVALGRGLLLANEGMVWEGLLELAEDQALALLVRLCSCVHCVWFWAQLHSQAPAVSPVTKSTLPVAAQQHVNPPGCLKHMPACKHVPHL